MSENYPSTLIIFYESGESETISFYDGGEMPSEIVTEKWVSSSAWRGYTDWELAKGYVEIADGWVTGYPDESVNRKVELNEIFEGLKQEKLKPPCTLYWVFGPTSNVFSTSSMVFCKKKDVPGYSLLLICNEYPLLVIKK